MAHDANFVGNRLRLSAFLQCVEHGEMPARPSRFRRRPQILDESAKSLVPVPPRVDCNVPVLEAYNEPLVLTSKTSMEARAIMSNVDEEAAIDNEPLEINVSEEGEEEEEEEEDLSKGPMRVTSIYDMPQSPVPHLRLTPASVNDQDSYNRSEEGQRRSESKSVSQFKRKAIATATVVEKTSERTKGLSSTRKRRLPVHGLALLRTTTLYGLPLPGDATAGFAIPITIVDPIEDSQTHLPDILSNRTSRNLIIATRRLSPRITQLSHGGRSTDTGPAKSTVKPFQASSPLSTADLQYRLDSRDACDGFIGPELQLTSTRGSSRRGNTNLIKRQKPGTIRELALGAGSLPVSTDRDMAISAVLAIDRITNRDGRLTSSRPGDIQPNSRVRQLVLTRTQSTLQANVVVEGIPY